MSTKPEVQEYLNALADIRRERGQALHQLILAAYPQIEISMKYRMPTYCLDSGWVAWASQKQYLSLYTCGAEHLAVFTAQHPNIKTGKGCINFRDRDRLPLDDLQQVIRHAIGSR